MNTELVKCHITVTTTYRWHYSEISLFWTAVLLSVLVLCSFQIYFLWQQYNSGKIIISQKITRLPVTHTPFPAITVCSESQLNQSKLILAKDELEEAEYRGLNSYIDIVCRSNVNYSSSTNMKIYHPSLEYAFKNLTAECSKVLLKLFWMNATINNPCDYAQPVVLETGLCFTLNMVPHETIFSKEFYSVMKSYWKHKYRYEGMYRSYTWSPPSGYSNDSSEVPPWRVKGMGAYNSVLLVADSHPLHFKNHCNISDNGLTPINSIYVRPNAWNKLVISPRLISNSWDLRHWNPIARNCFYQHERPLKFFKIYSLNNCEVECRANKTKDMCGCVSHFDPRTKNTPICNPTRWECIVDARSSKFSVLDNKNNANEYNNYTSTCLCLPSCTEFSYSLLTTKLMRNFSQIENVDSSLRTMEIGEVTTLYMYFKHNEVDEKIRFPLTRFHEVVANIGGVMSLCIGCSIVSLFEIIYFMTFRKLFPTLHRKSNGMTLKRPNPRHGIALKSYYNDIWFRKRSNMTIKKC